VRYLHADAASVAMFDGSPFVGELFDAVVCATGANHRMLSTYVNTLRRHGLSIEELAEPAPSPEWADERRDAARLPIYLVARCVRR